MSFFFGGRKKQVDLEADLFPADGSPGVARVKYKRYEDGGELFRCTVAMLRGLEHRTDAELVVDGEPVLTLILEKCQGRVERTERSLEGLPRLAEGQRLELRHGGQTRLAGTVEQD